MPIDIQKTELDLSFEDTAVKMILAAGGWIPQLAKYRVHACHSTGDDNLTVDWFRGAFPKFPVRFFSPCPATLATPAIADLFFRFDTTEPYCLLAQSAAQHHFDLREINAGLIFTSPERQLQVVSNFWRMPTARVRSQRPFKDSLSCFGNTAYSILHQFGRSSSEFNSFLCELESTDEVDLMTRFISAGEGPGSGQSRGGCCFTASVGKPPIVFVIESLESFLKSIGKPLILRGLTGGPTVVRRHKRNS